jgi:PAS domain S-box-containing protein
MAPASSIFTFSSADSLLQAALAVSLTAINLLRPLRGDKEEIVDFTLEYVNPAGQRLASLPERPAGTLRTLFPHAQANGLLDFYCRVFETGEPGNHDFTYPADGHDTVYLVAAQRSGALLVASLTSSANLDRPAIAHALQASQAREKKARLAAERERNLLNAIIAQAPVAICVFQGEDQTVATINAQMCAIWGATPVEVLGRPLLEGMPALHGQGFTELIGEVARTGVPFVGREVAAHLPRQGRLETGYFNFVYQPLYTVEGALLGVLEIAVDVTEQVQGRQEVQNLNEELATANEELQAANEEFFLNNEALTHAQLQFRQLNQELESRVAERTAALLAAQHEAEHQRERLERFFSQAPAAICILDGPDFVFELVNEVYQQLFPGRLLRGRPLLEALPELADQPVWHTLRHVYTTGRTHEEIGIRTPVVKYPGGPLEDFYFHYIQQARYDEHGHIDGVLVFALDITEQVLARQQRAAQQRQLHELFEQAPVAIAVLRGPDYIIDVANPLVSALWGRTPEQVVGRPLLEALPEVRSQGFKDLLDSVVQKGEALVAQEVPARLTRNGHLETAYLNFVYQPLRNPQGCITGVAAVATEVSEQVAARQQVAQANEQLHASNAELDATNQRLMRTNADLDNFIYTASHDLKAPITNIEGLLTALQEQLPPEVRQAEQVQQLLHMMSGAVERFQKTIAHLTDISRLQQAHAQLAEEMNLAEVVEDVRLDLAPELAATQASLEIDVASCPTVSFSPKNLRSIVYNLLSNALKYRAPDRPPVVQLRCHSSQQQVVLEVQDNGLGLDEAQQAQLFMMFQRLHSHVEGSGVGLYMVKKIVENAGGTIAVRSETGVGSTFVVTLPGQAG